VEGQLGTLRAKHRELEQRRALDLEGFTADVTTLRRLLSAVDRRLHQTRSNPMPRISKLYTLNPKPLTLRPLKPDTPNPKASTRKPQPQTLNPEPSTPNPQPSTHTAPNAGWCSAWTTTSAWTCCWSSWRSARRTPGGARGHAGRRWRSTRGAARAGGGLPAVPSTAPAEKIKEAEARRREAVDAVAPALEEWRWTQQGWSSTSSTSAAH
jgi:hypothetical protein